MASIISLLLTNPISIKAALWVLDKLIMGNKLDAEAKAKVTQAVKIMRARRLDRVIKRMKLEEKIVEMDDEWDKIEAEDQAEHGQGD